MNWLSAGENEDGWDDDGLEDLSDQSLEEDPPNAMPVTSTTIPPPDGAAPDGVALGGGLFMGRLTQFLDTVAQPEETEPDSGDGWNDDDLDVEDLDLSEQATPQPAPLQPPGYSQDNGWEEDDLDLDESPQKGLHQPDEIVPLNDTLPAEPVPPAAPARPFPVDDKNNRNVSFGSSEAAAASSGWDDDLVDGLDDIDINAPTDQPAQMVDHTPPPPPAPSNRQVSSMSNPSSASEEDGLGTKSEVAVASSTGWDGDDDDLDELIAKDSDPQRASSQMVDHTPPPPPPPPKAPESTTPSQSVSFAGGAASTAAVATVETGDEGWDEDGLLDDVELDEGVNDTDLAQGDATDKLVDVTPPPPPPPRDNKVDASAVALADGVPHTEGWEEDDLDDVEDDVGEDQNDNAEPVVDHTPPPPPPRDPPRRRGTDIAIADDLDDISRDDTLSIANSRVRLGEDNDSPLVDKTPLSITTPIQLKRSETADAVRSSASAGSSTMDDFRQSTGETNSSEGASTSQPEAPVIVDHTPSVSSANYSERHATSEESMIVLPGGGGTHTGSSVADSLDSSSERMSESRQRTGKMVDHTPPARFQRGLPVETSLAVAGHTSVGESLDSIDEEDEETDSIHGKEATTPGAIEAGWGSDRRISLLTTVTDDEAGESMAIPFGSAVTPTAAGGTPARSTFESSEISGEEGDDDVPLVDHTPHPTHERAHTATSVEVLSVSSEEGDLGESMVGVDDVKEDLYGQVVDHTPATPTPSELPKVGPSAAAIAKLEDDTVAALAENTDVEGDIKQDDEMDDESSRGTKTTLEDFESRSLISAVPLTIPEEKQLVDYVPSERKAARTADASTIVFADASTASSHVDDNVNDDDDDDASPARFGPIVDHTPNLTQRSTRSVATSVVTQNTGLETETKLDDEMDNTVDAGTTGEDGWETEQGSLVQQESDEKHLVDHVPKRSNSRLSVEGSMHVLVDIGDDLTQVDTIAEETVVDFGPIVDQTPLGARSVGHSVAMSMITQGSVADKQEEEFDNTTAQAASVGGGDGWDNDMPDLEDMSAGDNQPGATLPEEDHLVDRVPRRSFSRPADASTMVLIDPLDAVSEVDDEGMEQKVVGGRFGPVVDHTPAPPRINAHMSVATSVLTQASGGDTENRQDDDLDGGTWFGASTTGGTSETGASGEDRSGGDDSTGDGWDDDAIPLDDLASPQAHGGSVDEAEESHVVDHVPKLTGPRPADASTAVAMDPSIVSSQNKNETEDTIDGGSFGAVVDHTPSVTRGYQPSVANSMATNVTGLATDIKQDEDMDETTWNGGVSAQGDGWDQDEPELEELAELVEADDDQRPSLVDHIPERPESRPTDASTLVAGDPSEILSQGDDFGQDETNFGPVVDQTPITQVAAHRSAAGSTIVNIASVAEDDLDVAVEKAIDGDDQDTPASEQVGWQAPVPNPQSGNEEETPEREQLVDYVPEEQEDELPDLVRDGSSEMATVGERTATLPADDPKEDEFGPVVDHTPVPVVPATAAATSQPEAPQLEAESKKPASSPSEKAANMDSVVPNFSVESEEEKDGGLEEDEFGPVVDHLPTTSSRASLATSRGGSTVDALATVSEVEDDYVAGDGWEDDVDIDVGEQASPAASSRPGEDRNLSVKWLDRLSEKDSAAFLQKSAANVSKHSTNSDAGYSDSNMGDSARLSLNETRYYDPDAVDGSGWGDSVDLDDIDNVDEGDDIPTSTPRGGTESENGANAAVSTVPANENGECSSCSNSPTLDCPCVKKLLAVNGIDNAMVGDFKTPEGGTAKVNLGQLLQTEITKRHLLEKECEALGRSVETLKSTKVSLVLAGETQMDVLNKLQEANEGLTDDLGRARDENADLKVENKSLQSRRAGLEGQIATLDAEKTALEEQTMQLRRDVARHETEMAAASKAEFEGFSQREQDLNARLSELKQSNGEFSHKISRFETECANLQGKNESLYEDLEAYRLSVSQLEEQNASMQSKESALNAEIQHLKESLENSKGAAVSSDNLAEEMGGIKSELASKTGECTELFAQLQSLQRKLTSSEAGNFKHTKELARLEAEHSRRVADSEQRLAAATTELEQTRKQQADVAAHVSNERAEAQELIDKLRGEKQALEEEKAGIELMHQKAVQDQQRRLSQAETNLRSTGAKVVALEQEKLRLSSEVSQHVERAKVAESQSLELLSVAKERDLLRGEIEVSKSTIDMLERKSGQFEAEREKAARQERELFSLRQEREQMRAELASSKRACDETSKKLESTERTNNELQAEHKRLQLQIEATANKTMIGTLKEETKLASQQREIEAVKGQLQSLTANHEALQTELETKNQRCSDLDADLEDTLADLESASSRNAALETQLQEHQQNFHALQKEKEASVAERDGLASKLQELQKTSMSAIDDAKAKSNQAWANQMALNDISAKRDTALRDLKEVTAVRDQKLQEVGALVRELAETKMQIMQKDQAIAALREEQQSSAATYVALQESNDALSSQMRAMSAAAAGSTSDSEQVAVHVKTLEDELARVCQERDNAVRERDVLTTDSEEMLIQLGILKEAMDAGEEHASQMQEDLEGWNSYVKEAEQRLEGAENRLEEVSASLVGPDGKSRQKQRIESENVDLMALIDRLEGRLAELESIGSPDGNAASALKDLESTYQGLVSTCREQEVRIDQLQQSLNESQAVVKESSELRMEVDRLETCLSDSNRLLSQKEGALHDLLYQLDNPGKAPAESAELQTLQQTIREMEDRAGKDRNRIRELEQLRDDKERKSQDMAIKVEAAERLVQQLNGQLEDNKAIEVAATELQIKLDEAVHSLKEAEHARDILENDAEDLRRHVASLETHPHAKEQESALSPEIQSLREQIEILKQKQLATSTETGAREEVIEHEVHVLQSQMKTKDEQISSLERELHSLGIDLSDKHEELTSKQVTVEKLSTELEDLRSRSSSPATSPDLDLADMAGEDAHEMGSQLVALARALEYSESRRAEAIERLEKERKSNADSLRRLAESVKRYYSTVSFET